MFLHLALGFFFEYIRFVLTSFFYIFLNDEMNKLIAFFAYFGCVFFSMVAQQNDWENQLVLQIIREPASAAF